MFVFFTCVEGGQGGKGGGRGGGGEGGKGGKGGGGVDCNVFQGQRKPTENMCSAGKSQNDTPSIPAVIVGA